MTGISDHRAGIWHRLRATPAGGILRMETITDLADGALAARRNVPVVVPLLLAPGRFVVPRRRRHPLVARVVPGVVIPLVRVVRKLEPCVHVLLIAGELARRHVPHVCLNTGGRAYVD